MLLIEFLLENFMHTFTIHEEFSSCSFFLNGRCLGIYAWLQGVNRAFLETAFPNSSGTLIEGELEDWTAKSRLRLEDRQEDVLNREIDPSASIALNPTNAEAFLLGELLVAHEDGCAFNRNNYWLYYSNQEKLGHIFPHTMDAAYRSHSMIGVTVRCRSLLDYLGDQENCKQLLSALEFRVNDTAFWRAFFTEYDSRASNLLISMAAY